MIEFKHVLSQITDTFIELDTPEEFTSALLDIHYAYVTLKPYLYSKSICVHEWYHPVLSCTGRTMCWDLYAEAIKDRNIRRDKYNMTGIRRPVRRNYKQRLAIIRIPVHKKNKKRGVVRKPTTTVVKKPTTTVVKKPTTTVVKKPTTTVRYASITRTNKS